MEFQKAVLQPVATVVSNCTPTQLSLALFFGSKLLSAKKFKNHCELATDCSFAKISRRKMRLFFLRLQSFQTIGFLEFLSLKFNYNYFYGRENQNNLACQSNQTLIENFAEDTDIMSSVHFWRISLIYFDQRTKKSNTSIKLTVP